jgi:hypothetical protein
MSKSTGRLSIFYLCIYLLNYISCACTSASSLQLVRPSIQDRALLEVNEEALSHIELIYDDLYIIGGNYSYLFDETKVNFIEIK